MVREQTAGQLASEPTQAQILHERLSKLRECYANLAERLTMLRDRAIGCPPLPAGEKGPKPVPSGIFGELQELVSEMESQFDYIRSAATDLERIA